MNPIPATTHDVKNAETMTTGSPSIVETNGSRPELVETGSAEDAMVLMDVWRERRFILKVTGYGLLLAAIVSFLIPPKYQSTARLTPPEKRGLSGLAGLLAATEDKTGSLVGGLVSEALGVKSSSALYVGVLKSSTIQNNLINRFDLRKVYDDRYMKDAREDLAHNSDIDEDRKNGIITITVADRSPQRSMELAQAYVENLNSLIAELNTSEAHRERVFLEQRLKNVKQDLDEASKELSEFSSQNLTLDVKEQGKAMVSSVATLEGELIAAESQMSGLEQIYTSNNVRVRTVQARVDELRRNLAQLRGNSPLPGDGRGDGFGISIATLPKLGVTYYDLYRRVKIQETVFEILTQQLEMAKIEEAKELPTIGVLDKPRVPETKSTPKRFLIILIGTLLAAVVATGYVVAAARGRSIDPSDPFSLFGLEMREGFAEDVEYVRNRIPEAVQRVASSLLRRRAKKDDVA